jgi:hypothetical protein
MKKRWGWIHSIFPERAITYLCDYRFVAVVIVSSVFVVDIEEKLKERKVGNKGGTGSVDICRIDRSIDKSIDRSMYE